MATDQDWDSYDRAVVDVAPPGRVAFRIVPGPAGATDDWPVGVVPPVVVITAWDPDSVRLPPGQNRERDAHLVAELNARGLVHWPATGRDLGTPHAEEGHAVSELSEAEAVTLGRRHGQAAVYVWTPDAWMIVSCTDDRCHVHGWRLTDVPGPTG